MVIWEEERTYEQKENRETRDKGRRKRECMVREREAQRRQH